MYCEVHILDVPYHLDRPFDYECGSEAVPGELVKVPFGKANKLRLGVITRIKESAEGKNTKPVHSSLDRRISLTDQMRGLCHFLKEHTLCTFGEAVRCILPPGALNSDTLGVKLSKTVSLAISVAEAGELLQKQGRAGIRSEGQRALVRYLIGAPSADISLVRAIPGVTPANISALRERGVISISEREEIRNPYKSYAAVRDTSPVELSSAQNVAFADILSLYESDNAKCALLHGVTGSGKTKIIIKTIDKCIEDGKRAIMLVPEIALTPQTVRIFCSRYGEGVAVIHSSLSQGERQDAYKRIRRGEVNLVIGTRSAIFAPVENLGLIVIDEEHEHTYKSESDPKYHARDVAAYLCGKNNALLLLASATPSVESYYKAKSGAYTLVSLKERYGSAKLPDAVIVDMREELRLGNTSPISERLVRELKGVEQREEQAILFLNRRGFNSQVNCPSCGEVVTCPRCSVALTYHSHGRPKMLCHLCGHEAPVPRSCAGCGAEGLKFLGSGTQKAESELCQFLPDMTLMRMDADTAFGKLAYDKMLGDFREGKADILLGTQMVAKGHDFPRVTLVGVVLADTSLFVSDFRASERTFSLLTQVIGRAGRAKEGGIAVIQTFSPKNEIINLACAQDYEAFYEGEIAVRRELTYPPFCDLVALGVTADTESEAMKISAELSQELIEKLKSHPDIPFIVFGPFEAAVYKVNEKYRMRMVVKCRLSKASREIFSEILKKFSEKSKSATVSIDLNPLTV